MTPTRELDFWLMALQQSVAQLVCLGVDHEIIEEAVDRAYTRGQEQAKALRAAFGLDDDE